MALKAEDEVKAASTAPPAADEGGAPSDAVLSLACVGCARLPSDMGDDREKHPVCPKCVKLKVPTTYFCGPNCPGNTQAWQVHVAYHKKLKQLYELREDGGVAQQQHCEAAERQARIAAQTGDKYQELLAEGLRYGSKRDFRRAARALRKAIALKPDRPEPYYNLGAVLGNSRHYVEAAQLYFEAKERFPVGSEEWADATANAFDLLQLDVCSEVAKPEWWIDEGLKALSARVMRAAPNNQAANLMRARVLRGHSGAWAAGPRLAAELKEAAVHYTLAAALHPAPAVQAQLANAASWCRGQAEAM